MRPLVFLLAALAAAGCDSALTDGQAFSATLSTDKTAYALGADATLRIENTGSVPIEFGPPSCWAALEAERTTGAWGEIARPDRPTCGGAIVVLPAGETSMSPPIDLDVPAGTYRLLLNVSDGDEEVRLSTDPFVVG
ncbi:hypothetical protein RQM47_01130 [Rubrivirga sp. S365]|uniref:BACON domain-containing protein n=1 Tax=Rubrivirga litoralis TaxID=3075598 RepID=A0ABU3BT96_9BACT|nr:MULTISPECIES: hypothetical protein [unclassified Rubrivirga]MDT0632391.1 hypothetical protein [Rubrivirga sp. F394]MDT7855238.1 hypothetical protein [Rubrivirga sp. S365]